MSKKFFEHFEEKIVSNGSIFPTSPAQRIPPSLDPPVLLKNVTELVKKIGKLILQCPDKDELMKFSVILSCTTAENKKNTHRARNGPELHTPA